VWTYELLFYVYNWSLKSSAYMGVLKVQAYLTRAFGTCPSLLTNLLFYARSVYIRVLRTRLLLEQSMLILLF